MFFKYVDWTVARFYCFRVYLLSGTLGCLFCSSLLAGGIFLLESVNELANEGGPRCLLSVTCTQSEKRERFHVWGLVSSGIPSCSFSSSAESALSPAGLPTGPVTQSSHVPLSLWNLALLLISVTGACPTLLRADSCLPSHWS